MNTKHTPGPWNLQDYGWSRTSDSGHPVFMGRIADSKGEMIHSGSAFGIFGRTEEECEANAKLIAAAPELLEALKELDECYCEIGNELSKEDRHRHRLALIKTRAAIKKATE